MNFLLLLIVSLTTGCEANFDVKACHQGWVQFTCKYPQTNKTYQDIRVVVSNGTTLRSSRKDEWKNKGRFSLYHDTKSKNLQVAIAHLQHEDFGEYECQFYQSSNSSPDIKKRKLEPEKCQRPVSLTVYVAQKTTITCDYPGDHQSRLTFLCRKNKFTCGDFSPTKKRAFTLTNTSRGFNLSISHVGSQDAGVYCCGMESNNGDYRFSLQQISLDVIVAFKRSASIGQNFTYWCKYNQNVASFTKFICKGEDPATCQPLINTREPDLNSRFSMNDDRTVGNISITVTEVTANDSGTYWCGAERTDGQPNNTFFNRLFLTVGNPVSPKPPDPESLVSSEVELVVIICVALLLLMLLMFVMVLILIYKRFSRLKSTGSEAAAAAQHIKEDNIYEEVLQYPPSETATNTVYVAVNLPNQPASLHYSTISFQRRPNTAAGEALTVKPSSSACKYSAVKFSSSVSQLYRPAEEPFYSTANRPQKK